MNPIDCAARFDHVVQKIQEALLQHKVLHPDSKLELEAILDLLDNTGHIQQHPSLDKDTMHQLMNYAKQELPSFLPNAQYQETTDYFYPDNIRHRLIKDGKNGQLRDEWRVKTLVQQIDFRIPERNMGFRINIKTEIPTSPLPKSVKATFVRAKRTMPLINKQNNTRLDFSQVWSGQDEETCRKAVCVYEAEIEPQLDSTHLSTLSSDPEKASQQVAGSLVFQILDLVGFSEPLSIQPL